jgi:hypothetical protein
VGTGDAGYCYGASPLTPNRTGTRSFGGDSSGVLAGSQQFVDCCLTGALNTANCVALN